MIALAACLLLAHAALAAACHAHPTHEPARELHQVVPAARSPNHAWRA